MSTGGSGGQAPASQADQGRHAEHTGVIEEIELPNTPTVQRTGLVRNRVLRGLFALAMVGGLLIALTNGLADIGGESVAADSTASAAASSRASSPAPSPSIPMYGGSYAWGQTAEGLQRPGDGRRRYRYECPPGGGPQLFIVTGTRVYTADSSICNAAVHCGVLNPEGGGPVMIEVRPGPDHYRGTSRHGITSYSLPEPWSASFVFVTPPSRPSDLDVKQVAGRCFKGMKYLRGAAAAERPAA